MKTFPGYEEPKARWAKFLGMGLVAMVLFVGATLAQGLSATEPALTTHTVATGLVLPVFVCAPPNDSTRLFVLEQHTGKIVIVHLSDGSLSTFLTIGAATTGQELTQGDEQGLLGMAFHPQYATNGFFYVNYTTTGGSGGQTIIERYHTSSAELADPASHTPVLSFDQPETNHNGGWLGFGPDGFLYLSTGDGGGGNDQHGTIGNGQDRTNLLGKILRIDVNGGSPYAIPASNPYAGSVVNRPEIWAFGLRNPFRCAFDRANGNLWIGDVGQNTREEIDIIPAGVGDRNFGWRCREGPLATPNIPAQTPVTPATEPIYNYPHTNGNAVITGGYVYRGLQIAGLQGAYFFTDFAGKHFWSIRSNGTTNSDFTDHTNELSIGGTIGNVSSFGEDAAGEVYMVDYSNGQIVKIISAESTGTMLITVTRLSSHINFAQTGADTLMFQAAVPAQPGFDPNGKLLTLNVGGAATTFTLDAKGNGTNAAGSAKLSFKKGTLTGFRITLRNGMFAPQWLDEGINPAVDASKQDVTFVIAATLDTQSFQATAHVVYSAKKGKSGRFSLLK